MTQTPLAACALGLCIIGLLAIVEVVSTTRAAKTADSMKSTDQLILNPKIYLCLQSWLQPGREFYSPLLPPLI